MKYLLYTMNGDGLGLAWRLAKEGNEVKIFFANPKVADSLKDMVPRAKTLSAAVAQKPIVIFDMVGFGALADRLRRGGLKVIGAGMGPQGKDSLSDKLELDRYYALDVMDALKIKIPPMQKCKSAEEGTAFLKKNPGKWVIKPNNNLPTNMTFIGQDSEQLISQIELWKTKLRGGFVIQKFIAGVEMSTEIFFSNGVPILPPNSTFETKKFLNDDLGPQTGCQTSVVWGYREKEPRIYQKTLKKLLGLMKGTGYTGPLDINTIVSYKDGEAYGLEFCPRFGYNAIYAMLQAIDMETGKFLSDLAEGKLKEIKWKPGFGGAVRVTIPPYPFDSTDKELKAKIYGETAGTSIGVDFKDPALIPLDVMYEDGDFKVVGIDGAVLEVTGYGADLSSMARTIYEKAFSISLPNKQFRTDMSRDARKRWEGLVELGYLRGENNGISAQPE